jgi:hypothetical protein
VSAKHNHPPRPFGAMVNPGNCPRCDERRAERAAEGLVDHTHELLSFGRLKGQGECPRCDQLHNGAEARPAHRNSPQRAAEEDARRREEIREHFASAKHRNECGSVCTFGEW